MTTPPTLPSSAEWQAWGVDPSWSQTVVVPSHDGRSHHWHLLRRRPAVAASSLGTIVCLHGNPTWSYLWRGFLAQLGDRYDVIAPDHLSMGYSDRLGTVRRYADRVLDIDDLLRTLDVQGPIYLAAHDWGGAIALGWAVAHRERVAGLLLTNTGIAVPAGTRGPGVIRFAAASGVTDFVGRRTPIFVAGTGLLPPAVAQPARSAYLAPYRHAVHRRAIADFVADVPFSPKHPSFEAIASVAAQVSSITAPVLLAFGSKDPVFGDSFLDDLSERLPHASRHRFANASHLVQEAADISGLADAWLTSVASAGVAPGQDVPERTASTADASGVDPSLARFRANDKPGLVVKPEVDGFMSGSTDVRDGSGVVLDQAAGASTVSDGGADRPLWAAIEERAADLGVAFYDDRTGESITWAALAERVHAVALGLRMHGCRAGDRVALVTPPGPDLVVVLYGCWRAGLVPVIADKGLGMTGLGRAIRSARPRWIIGPPAALAAARALRWAPGARSIQVGSTRGPRLPFADALLDDIAPVHPHWDAFKTTAAGRSTQGNPDPCAAAKVDGTLDRSPGSARVVLTGPSPGDLAAVLFTSGATGPAKGVRYRHRQLMAQRDALVATYGITENDRLVAAFAPFALYGPALGIPSAVSSVEVTKPGALTAEALASACRAIEATMVFGSPSALANVVATAAAGVVDPAFARVRTVMSAGAPVPIATLRATSKLFPAASLHTPYGMTEALPVADISLAQLATVSSTAGGVNVGHAVPGARIGIAPIPPATLVAEGATGRVLVSAPWVSDGYDGLWGTQNSARTMDDDGVEWHDSGDVGHLDEAGSLWIEGRAVHNIWTANGLVTPVPVEVAAQTVAGVARAAAVAVGPIGAQQVVVVIEQAGGQPGLADQTLTAAVRAAVGVVPLAAVLTSPALPVDIRHNAKIDRTALGTWAAAILEGRAPRRRFRT